MVNGSAGLAGVEHGEESLVAIAGSAMRAGHSDRPVSWGGPGADLPGPPHSAGARRSLRIQAGCGRGPRLVVDVDGAVRGRRGVGDSGGDAALPGRRQADDLDRERWCRLGRGWRAGGFGRPRDVLGRGRGGLLGRREGGGVVSSAGAEGGGVVSSTGAGSTGKEVLGAGAGVSATAVPSPAVVSPSALPTAARMPTVAATATTAMVRLRIARVPPRWLRARSVGTAVRPEKPARAPWPGRLDLPLARSRAARPFGA